MPVSEHANSRYDTSMPKVTMGAITAVIALLVMLSIDVAWVTETFGYEKRTDARVLTFLIRMVFIRMVFLIAMLAGAFVGFTNLSYYKRNRVALAPWMFLSIGLAFFLVYVIIPIFQSISYSFTKWNGLYDVTGTWTGEWVGFENYRILFGDPNFYTSLANNILWLLLFMLAIPIGHSHWPRHCPVPQPDCDGHPHL